MTTTAPAPAPADSPSARRSRWVVYRTALYDASGGLLRASHAFPHEDLQDPQTVADLCARAADTGCTYEAGTFLVWTDPDTQPHDHIGQTPPADGSRCFGPPHPPVPVMRRAPAR